MRARKRNGFGRSKKNGNKETGERGVWAYIISDRRRSTCAAKTRRKNRKWKNESEQKGKPLTSDDDSLTTWRFVRKTKKKGTPITINGMLEDMNGTRLEKRQTKVAVCSETEHVWMVVEKWIRIRHECLGEKSCRRHEPPPPATTSTVELSVRTEFLKDCDIWEGFVGMAFWFWNPDN